MNVDVRHVDVVRIVAQMPGTVRHSTYSLWAHKCPLTMFMTSNVKHVILIRCSSGSGRHRHPLVPRAVRFVVQFSMMTCTKNPLVLPTRTSQVTRVCRGATLVRHGAPWCVVVRGFCVVVRHGAPWCVVVRGFASWCTMGRRALHSQWCVVICRGATWCMMVGHGASSCAVRCSASRWGLRLRSTFPPNV